MAAKISPISPIRSFVFMDCETTGLEQWSKITELCLVALQIDHLLNATMNEMPRVLNKLTLCFNPMKTINPAASEITGLYNDTLQHAAPFTDETVELLQRFLNHLPQPACLVAHNGHRFDFPILRNHILKAQIVDFITPLKGVLALDTLQLFRHQYKLTLEQQEQTIIKEKVKSLPVELLDDDWDELMNEKLDQMDQLDSDAEFIKRSLLMQQINETTPTKNETISKHHAANSKKKLDFGTKNKMPSFKLVDVYNRLTGEEMIQDHAAENDVIMMVKCAIILGQEFVDLANEMAVSFIEEAPK